MYVEIHIHLIYHIGTYMYVLSHLSYGHLGAKLAKTNQEGAAVVLC